MLLARDDNDDLPLVFFVIGVDEYKVPEYWLSASIQALCYGIGKTAVRDNNLNTGNVVDTADEQGWTQFAQFGLKVVLSSRRRQRCQHQGLYFSPQLAYSLLLLILQLNDE